MNRPSKVLVSVCIMFLVSPITAIACPPDCGECYDWDYDLQECVLICSGCCNCYAGGYCDDESFFCDTCEYCGGCECDCALVTSVSGISGPYAIGDSTTVTAIVDPYLPSGCSVSWSGGASFSNISGTTATATFTTSGANLYVRAKTSCQQYTSGWSSAFTVVKVVGVIASPDPACVGQNVTFGALTDPPNSAHLVTVGWTTTPSGNPAMGAGSQFTTNWSTGGTKTATAICGTSTAPKNVTVVKVDKLQYNDPNTGYTNISGTLYVYQGTTVTFKAIPDPPSASWPSGKPVWGGSSGASGTGTTKTLTFSTASTSTSDYKTVTAECGNTVTANVIVYWFQGIPVPDVIFEGRSYDQYGVEETVALAHTTYPSGITGLPLEWKLYSGVGSVSASTYDAEAIPGTVDLRLEIVSGPSKGIYFLYPKTVVAPINRFIRHRTQTGVWHLQGHHSVTFRGESFLDPKNVSFTNIQRREGASTPAVCTGIFAPNNGYIHPVGSWFTPSDPNITTGCYVVADTTGFDCGPGGVLGDKWHMDRLFH